jgi:hypothetical protein
VIVVKTSNLTFLLLCRILFQLLIVAAMALACVVAEPPIPRQGGYASQPSSRYGAPDGSGRFAGSNTPSTQYGIPGGSVRISGSTSQSTQYATASASSRFGNGASPSSQYGAPSSSSRFGGTSSLSASARFGGASSLSSQYGAPSASSRFGGASSPSTQYGAPADSSRVNVPRSQYAPNGGYAASRGGYNAQEDDLAVRITFSSPLVPTGTFSYKFALHSTEK